MAVVSRLMRDDVEPGLLRAAKGSTCATYQDQLRSRWHNAAVRHRLEPDRDGRQQKIPNRLVRPDPRAAGRRRRTRRHDARPRRVDALRVGTGRPTTAAHWPSTTR